LYGGIHFRDAIENGIKEGKQIGKFVIEQSTNVHTNSMYDSKNHLTGKKIINDATLAKHLP
jgi:hypothetical protein